MSRKSATLDQSLGDQIRVRRKSMGLTQAELASALGVSFQQVQKYERGISAISHGRLNQICEIMNLPPDFFGGMGDPPAGPAAGPARNGAAHAPAESDDISRFLTSGEGRRLIESFTSITDQRLRTRILDFIASVARDQPR